MPGSHLGCSSFQESWPFHPLSVAVPGQWPGLGGGKDPRGGDPPVPHSLRSPRPRWERGHGRRRPRWVFFLPGELRVPFLFSLFDPPMTLPEVTFCFLEMISLTWLLISCAQHEGLVSKTSLLVFYYLVSIPHKIVLNGKTLNSLPNQRLLFYFEASRVHSSEAEAALSFWWHEGQWCQAVGDSPLRAVPLFFYPLSGLFLTQSGLGLSLTSALLWRGSLSRAWSQSVSPDGHPVKTLVFFNIKFIYLARKKNNNKLPAKDNWLVEDPRTLCSLISKASCT